MNNIKLIESLYKGVCSADSSTKSLYLDKIQEVLKHCSEEEITELSKGALGSYIKKASEILDELSKNTLKS